MYIGIDLGTTNCKAAVFDGGMNMLSCVGMGYPLIVRSGTEIEQDANAWWDCVLQVMESALEQSGIDRKAVQSVSVSAQGISIVPVAEDGTTLSNAISWMDTRAEAQEQAVLEAFSAAEIFRRTGKRASRIYSLPKLMWMKAHMPEIYASAYKFLLPMDYIVFKLSGRMVTDHTIAAGTMLYNVNSRSWDTELLAAFGLEAERLPKVGEAGETVGCLLPQVAEKLGLSDSVCVALGGQDQKCAALGAGIGEGVATVSLGTGSCISALWNHPVLDENQRIPCFTYLNEGEWVLEGVLSTGAACYDWFHKNFCPALSFDELNALAANTPAPGAERFYPSLSGASSPAWDSTSGALAGLTLDSSLGSLARAVLEGVAYGIRENLEVMRELGVRVNCLRVFGGGAKSPLWLQIIANVCNLPVEAFSSGETALRGAALLAARAVGAALDAAACAEHRIAPESGLVEKYNAAYTEYQRRKVC